MRGTQFTCFTGTKVQILTLRAPAHRHTVGDAQALNRFTGIKVQILTLRAAARAHTHTHTHTHTRLRTGTLRGMRLVVTDEARCPVTGYSIDMRVLGLPSVLPLRAHDGSSSSSSSSSISTLEAGERDSAGGGGECVVEAGWAVEYDGQCHFLAVETPGETLGEGGVSRSAGGGTSRDSCGVSAAPGGSTLIKRHQLELLGYTLVSVPFWEWESLPGRKEREEYLRAKLQMIV